MIQKLVVEYPKAKLRQMSRSSTWPYHCQNFAQKRYLRTLPGQSEASVRETGLPWAQVYKVLEYDSDSDRRPCHHILSACAD